MERKNAFNYGLSIIGKCFLVVLLCFVLCVCVCVCMCFAFGNDRINRPCLCLLSLRGF